jgi:hypothetical protein
MQHEVFVGDDLDDFDCECISEREFFGTIKDVRRIISASNVRRVRGIGSTAIIPLGAVLEIAAMFENGVAARVTAPLMTRPTDPYGSCHHVADMHIETAYTGETTDYGYNVMELRFWGWTFTPKEVSDRPYDTKKACLGIAN